MHTIKKLSYCLCFGWIILAGSTHAQTKIQALIPKAEIALPNVKGGFDLMAFDAGKQRLFLSAQDNHSVEVIDLKNNKALISLPGFNEPKWTFYQPETNTLYVATGKDGKVTAVNAATYKTIKTYQFKEKCNNLRYDQQTKELFVGVGNTFGAIGIIDLKTQQITRQIPLAGFPKQFEVTADRIYVNEPGKSLIEVIDRKRNKVVKGWPVKSDKENVPMAIDQPAQRLYIGCAGGRLLVISTADGRELGRVDIPKDVDGVYFDKSKSRLYVSCGEGFLDTFSIQGDKLTRIQRISTRSGAGTGLFIPAAKLYVLAEPQTGKMPAALRIFQPAL